MKSLFKAVAPAVAVLIISANSLFATAVVPTITIDEWGKGDINGAPLTFVPSLPEPFSGMATLAYNLPAGFAGAAGDVRLFESGPTNGVQELSDVIRFDGQGHMFFFSDRSTTENHPPSLADVGLPAPVTQFPVIQLLEVGPEGGLNGYWGYIPVAGQPGFNPNAPGTAYNFISDVPEPGSVALFGLAGSLLLVARMRRQVAR
jgi:hypothetical protein